jgi:hypothetical protein
MTDIGFLYGRTRADDLYLSQTVMPLIRWKSLLHDSGFAIRFSDTPGRKILECPCVFVADFLREPSGVLPSERKTLERLRTNGARIIYFDNSDSCGTAQFQVLPFVDLYVKRQLYRDRSFYSKHFHGLRNYTHFMHERFGIIDDQEERRTPLPAADSGKVMAGWNSGLGNYYLTNRWLRAVNRRAFAWKINSSFIPGSEARAVVLPPERRRYDVHYRARISFPLKTITFGRRKAGELLAALESQRRMRVCRGRMKGLAAFHDELAQSRAVVSPFGFGEICRRDFEGFMHGCVVCKPDMGHCETWPEYYVPGATYLPYTWDFTDFSEVVERAVSPLSAAIARQGRELFEHYLSERGGEEFCMRFGKIIEAAGVSPKR